MNDLDCSPGGSFLFYFTLLLLGLHSDKGAIQIIPTVGVNFASATLLTKMLIAKISELTILSDSWIGSKYNSCWCWLISVVVCRRKEGRVLVFSDSWPQIWPKSPQSQSRRADPGVFYHPQPVKAKYKEY